MCRVHRIYLYEFESNCKSSDRKKIFKANAMVILVLNIIHVNVHMIFVIKGDVKNIYFRKTYFSKSFSF